MAKATKRGHQLVADFTEDTVGFAVESFLAFLSFPRFRFSLEPFSRSRERWLGADARLNGRIAGFKPFYMQFKRPYAFPDSSTTSQVIRERKLLKLPVAPRAMYFKLQDKKPTHHDYQHNVLLRLRTRLVRWNFGDAAYVCPLFLDRSAYRFHVYMAGLRRWPKFWLPNPWQVQNVLINRTSGAVNFNAIPVLREHVSIPPHAPVTSARHRYSFTEQGTDLCFHSPLRLPEGVRTLADFLQNVVGPMDSERGFIAPEAGRGMLQELFGEQGAEEPHAEHGALLPEGLLHSEDDGIASWMYWGNYLKTEYQIEQFAIVRWAD